MYLKFSQRPTARRLNVPGHASSEDNTRTPLPLLAVAATLTPHYGRD